MISVKITTYVSLSPPAGSTTGFQVDKSLLTREVNSIVVTLVSSGGFTKDLTLNLGQYIE